ncbi:MAG: DUF4347 domain-containing protein [Cyanobacteria bacterium P01_E01_bin.6]
MQAVQPQLFQPSAHLSPIRAKKLIVMDESVSVPQSTIESLSKRAIALSITSHQDVFQVISSTLRCQRTITCLHLFAQSQNGLIQCGHSVIDCNSIEQYSWDLHDWFVSVSNHVLMKRPQIHVHLRSSGLVQIEPNILSALTQLTGAEVIVS